jgi:DNA repair protein SbcC/Rad50
MRIIAIRGCNLASLAGEFEIDLTRAPLAEAGVFAIVGNTGAGKSTLLDALCVALFDRTPRLTNHSRVVVGRAPDDPGALGAQDARTLLRRGAAAGWAEVDFESGDRRRYRARWSVRRARNHADGTLQDQQLSLVAIDNGERLGGTKTETLKAIVARLGLSFDQFRRSALLAQGEFAAFLRADGKDRSELLERMTGTEIYTRLSVAAHVRAALAEQTLREGRAAALAIPVLDDAARAAAEAELALAGAAKQAARERVAVAERAARWLAEQAARERALAEAQAQRAAAVAAVAAAEPVHAELALRRRAEQLRASWDEAARLERQLAVARNEASAAASAAGEARAAQTAIADWRAAVVAASEPIRAARIATRMVERAVASPGGSAGDVLERARGAVGAAAWLAARAAVAHEVAGWPELQQRFAEHDAAALAVAAIDRVLAGHGESRVALLATRDAVAAEHQIAAGRLATAQSRAATYQQRRGLTLDAARRQEDQARAHLKDVEALLAIAAAARQAVSVRDEIDRRLAELVADERTDGEQRALIDAAIAIDTALRAERAAILTQLRQAAGFEHARAELVTGEPCPLCGATEHPWRDRGAFDDVIAAAEARLAEVSARLEAAQAQVATLAARSHQRGQERGRLERHRATTIASAHGTDARWREQLAALGELILIEDPATPAAEQLAAERDVAAKQRLEAARATRHQTEAATKAAAEAQAEVQLAQAGVDQQAARLVEVAGKLAELEANVERARGERAGRLHRQRELAELLERAIARWCEAVPGDAAAPVERHSPADPVVRPSRPHVPAEAQLRTVARAHGGVGFGFGEARALLEALVAAWHERAELIADLDAQLAATLATIEREAQAAERAAAEQTVRLGEAERRRDALVTEHAQAAERCESARTAAGFERSELARLLADDPARIDELADQLAGFERTVERARAVVVERERLVADHAGSRPASVDDAPLLAELAAAADAAEAHAARLVATLAADADARERRTTALATLAEVEAGAEVDRVLGEVIGSHDGKLFRSFAQSLTLDSLLAVANAHLDELAPRYQLERVPRHDLELQVIDRDLGAEVRSVQSLSGGESFLVSLALALGLSSMSAHDVRVRTLLIDEGFGMLDPATLDTALSVLDALQATGRQVGVISHVPALVERVGAHVRVVQRGGGRSEVIVA